MNQDVNSEGEFEKHGTNLIKIGKMLFRLKEKNF